MEENFNQIALTRANYYTPGSPVQFVCVELLRGDVSGENAVCLTFKNISRVVLTALEIHFKCKGADGAVLCEDDFEYRSLDAKPGESFGMDDAVFVTKKAITSVDVSLKNVYNGKRVVHLEEIKRVRLPSPKRLSPELQAALEERMARKGMKYMPQMLENGGWYCSCGAFHPKEEDTVYCSECGSDRILLQNALNSLLQPPAHAAGDAAATQAAAPAEPEAAGGATREVPFAPAQPKPAPAPEAVSAATREVPHAAAQPTPAAKAPVRAAAAAAPQAADDDYYDDDDAEDETMAETIIRWVPPIAAIICAAVALWGFVYYQFVL